MTPEIIAKHVKTWKELNPKRPRRENREQSEWDEAKVLYERNIERLSDFKSFRNLEDGTVVYGSPHRCLRFPYSDQLAYEEDDYGGKFKRLITQHKSSHEITLSVKDLKPILYSLSKFSEDLKVTINQDSIEFIPDGESGLNFVKWPIKAQVTEPFIFGVTSSYLYDVFKLASQLKISELDMHFASAVRPILFKGDELEYLIAPKRRH